MWRRSCKGHQTQRHSPETRIGGPRSSFPLCSVDRLPRPPRPRLPRRGLRSERRPSPAPKQAFTEYVEKELQVTQDAAPFSGESHMWTPVVSRDPFPCARWIGGHGSRPPAGRANATLGMEPTCSGRQKFAKSCSNMEVNAQVIEFHSRTLIALHNWFVKQQT